MSKVTESQLKRCSDELGERGLHAPESLLRHMVENNDALCECLEQRYGDETVTPKTGLDVDDRDILFDALAEHYTTERWWPMTEGPEDIEFRRFLGRLYLNLEQAGWTLRPTVVH